MDTTPATPAPVSPVAPGSVEERAAATGSPDTARSRVIIYQHSPLFYWWPVWLFTFIFAFVTWVSHHKMVIVPDGTQKAEKHLVEFDGKRQDRYILVFDDKYKPPADDSGRATVGHPDYFVSPLKSLGTA